MRTWDKKKEPADGADGNFSPNSPGSPGSAPTPVNFWFNEDTCRYRGDNGDYNQNNNNIA